jgi:hypothetical protein
MAVFDVKLIGLPALFAIPTGNAEAFSGTARPFPLSRRVSGNVFIGRVVDNVDEAAAVGIAWEAGGAIFFFAGRMITSSSPSETSIRVLFFVSFDLLAMMALFALRRAL